MNTPRTLGFAALVALASFTLPAQAHNVWLLPSSTVLAKSAWITVDAAVSNDLFFFNHVPLQLDNLSITAPSGQRLTPENMARGKLRSVFDLELREKGSYRLAVINAGLSATYTLKGENKRWRGTAAALAKDIPAEAESLKVTETMSRIETFVTVGAPTPLASEGRGLELVALSHPNDLVSGETGRFRMTVDGKPAAGIEISLLRGGTRYRNAPGETIITTDAEGNFALTWGEAGMYWLEAEHKDGRSSHPAAAERRLGYAATLEVLPN